MKFLPFSYLILASSVAFAGEPYSLKTIWSASAARLPLKSWSLSELSKLKTVTSQEKDLQSGKVDHWRGVLISKFVESALADLPLDQKAQVDLVIFRNAQGVQSVIPRNLVKNYPLLLALEKNHKALPESELSVVVPWTSSPKIASEGLPLPAFQLSGVTQVELASYRAQYEPMLLKRRTDPAAIRGEKMFVQTCISCHGAGRAPAITEISTGGEAKMLASTSHPAAVPGSPSKLTPRDVRALASYLDAYRGERAPMQARKQ